MISSMASITSSSATVRVEKATSEFLIGPDWTMNIDICDTINSNQMLAKDIVKAVKKRLQHKNPKVQLLALTLLETMVQNCGDYVHFQIAERNILPEMVRIVKKKRDMHVRDKILTLIDSWNETFGGSGGRYPQYYMAYEDLRHYGVAFPKRSPSSIPIIRPPMTHPPQPSYGMPSSSSMRLDQVMAENNGLSLSSLSLMREVLDLLADMLQAVDPQDSTSVKNEVIMELVEQCRTNQKKLMQMLTTTGDEELLGQGLEMNDKMQIVLAKHDAIASSSPLPLDAKNTKPESLSVSNEASPKSADTSVHGAVATSNENGVIDEVEEEEDDFAILARRHSIARNGGKVASETPSSPVSSNALVPVSTPLTTQTTDQNIIDLLSLTLSTTEQTNTPPQTMPQSQVPSNNEGVPLSDNAYPRNQVPALNSYVAPWARSHPQMQTQTHQETPTYYPNAQSQPPLYGAQPASQNQPLPPAYQTQQQSIYAPQAQSQYSLGYPPPPWAVTPGYYSSQNSVMRQPYTFSNAHAYDSANGEAQVTNNFSPQSSVPSSGQKPFIPSYRLFEDLDVFGNENGRFKAGNSAASSTSLSGSHNQSIVWGQK